MLLLLAAALAAQPISLDQVRAAAAAVTTLRLPFTQVKHLAILDEPLRTPGVLEVDRARGRARWEFTGKSLLVVGPEGSRRWDAQGRAEDLAARDPAVAAATRHLLVLISGDWTAVERAFTVTPDPGGAPRLALVPRDAALARLVERIELEFNDDLRAPRRLTVVGAGDDRTEYDYGTPELGIPLGDERFSGP
jgi:hypothetical protein